MKENLLRLTRGSLHILDGTGAWIGPLALRVLLAWEFFESGLEKSMGENWFADIMGRFPFPFSLIPADVSWQIATWSELLGGIALAIGLGTRLFGASLFILTLVAIASVHWPEHWMTLKDLAMGYVITDDGYGNFKLPVIYLGMLLPLILGGPGKLSCDALIARLVLKDR